MHNITIRLIGYFVTNIIQIGAWWKYLYIRFVSETWSLDKSQRHSLRCSLISYSNITTIPTVETYDGTACPVSTCTRDNSHKVGILPRIRQANMDTGCPCHNVSNEKILFLSDTAKPPAKLWSHRRQTRTWSSLHWRIRTVEGADSQTQRSSLV